MSFGPEYGWMRREWEGPSRDGCRQNRQCLAKAVASFAVQSPFGFSFISAHHSSLPTSGEQAASRTNAATSATARGIGRTDIDELPSGWRMVWQIRAPEHTVPPGTTQRRIDRKRGV